MAGSLVITQASADPESTVTVYKTPWCGCCHLWAEAVEQAGYNVTVKDMEDLSGIKKQAGVPAELEGCHTAVMKTGGHTYVLEGHVPLEAMARLADEQPDIRGVAVAGMPMGSLGMGDDPSASYDVDVLPETPSGAPAVFMHMGEGN
ncbi:DUF411 domain-containing protein [Roseibium sp. RKSG952]|uniref:DUF411 domain-containing protein n=1 Tax=Roseibium sp. RKSG952 TaxID=2529384 RepID=UPI001AD91379|nr:DUF411 domain-containing protein [Roseibium sp. RKSG952]